MQRVPLSSVPLNVPSRVTPRTKAILLWLLSDSIQQIINDDACNWKVIVNCGQGNVRTTIEQHRQLLQKS